jgi:hypothetical protein
MYDSLAPLFLKMYVQRQKLTRLGRTNNLRNESNTVVMKSHLIGPSLFVLLGLVIPSAYATTGTNVINTGDYVISNATFVNQTYTDRDATKYTLMGLLSNPSNKTIEGVDVFIQAFNENDGLIGFNNSTLSSVIESLQSKDELFRTLQSPFEISVDASNDDVFDHYELRIQ